MDSFSWRKSFFVYLGFSLLSFLLLVSSGSRVVLFFKDIENTIFYPFRFVVRGVGNKLANLGHVVSQEKENQAEIEKLQAEIEEYKKQIVNLRALQEDNDRLRELLDLKKMLEYDSITADVVGRDFAYGYSYITINKGRIDGIENRLPVVTILGMDKVVVGVVSEANLMTSKIKTFKSEVFDVGVYLPRTDIQSVAEGLGGTTDDVQLLYVDKSESVQKGDLVYTSGDSEIFPSNLLLGKVESIDNTNKTSTTYRIYLKPAVSLNRVREVFVLRPKRKSTS